MGMPASFKQILARLSAVLVLLMAFGVPQAAFAVKPYKYFIVGNPADVVLARPGRPSLVLMGGGPDVDDAFKWMISKSGGGNFVVIRTRGTDAYNPYIYAMGGASSVETIITPNRDAANDPFVISRIKGADALFIAGGDQSDYINYWQGTQVEAAIHELARKNVPIGGTSAGLSVMGQYAFTALNGTITSPTALSNPYDKTLTLGARLSHLARYERPDHRPPPGFARSDGAPDYLHGPHRQRWLVGHGPRHRRGCGNGVTGRRRRRLQGRRRLSLFPANRGAAGGMPAQYTADLPQPWRTAAFRRRHIRHAQLGTAMAGAPQIIRFPRSRGAAVRPRQAARFTEPEIAGVLP